MSIIFTLVLTNSKISVIDSSWHRCHLRGSRWRIKMAELILYNYFRSSTSYRARIALAHKELDYEYRPIHLLKNGGEQHSEVFRKLNPAGEVPCLIHNDKAISQSVAIIEYLDEVFPQKPLYPKDPYKKALVRQVCETINSGIHPLHNLKVFQKLGKDAGYNKQQNEAWAQHWVELGFVSIEKMLLPFSKKFAFGDDITAADVFIVPQMLTARRFGTDTTKFQLLTKIEKNCESLPEFFKTHPARQVDTPEDMKIS